MHVLIVCSYNNNLISPFIKEQADSVLKFGCSVDYFLIKGKGFFGYCKNIFKLRKQIKSIKPNIVHAHYGLSGLLAILQSFRPVIVTFHGSDINGTKLRFLSKIAQRFSTESIFVSDKLKSLSKGSKGLVIPCGVDLETFNSNDKENSKKLLGLAMNIKYVLFGSSFDNPIKNSSLAIDAVKSLSDQNAKLLELKGYTRQEVSLLLNAVDCALMTSFNEGSPQFIKEAMACNCPIVATDVGDIKEVIGKTNGCFISTFDSKDLALKLKMALVFGKRTDGRKQIKRFDNRLIAELVYNIYQSVIDNRKKNDRNY